MIEIAAMERNTRSMVGCLEWDLFVDLNLGNLSEIELASINEHVSTCPKCESKLLDWRNKPIADDLADKIQRCMSAPALAEEPAFRAMETAAIALVGKSDATPLHYPPSQYPPRVELVGQSIGLYKILEEVGRGGMGVVFRAEQHKLNRDVAIKMLRAGIYAGPNAFARFDKEAQAAGRLQHVGIVRLYDFAEHNGLPYFVMEYVNGGSLAKKLAEGLLPFRAAAELSRKIAEAVEFAHQNQVIHRDLKPSNILLAPDGSPKITDFGLAKLLDDQGDLTQSDTVLGTPSYMSPEQAIGGRTEIGTSTDVYAIGAILYEMITGKPPFCGDSKLETIRLVRETPVVPPSSLCQGVPRNLEAICLKCLEKSPARRYPTAQALADDLGRWLRNERPRDTPGRLERAGRTLRRHWVVIAVVVVVGMTVGLLRVAVYVRDPNRPLRQIQHELIEGRPVTLIESVGRPKWQRWQAGESSSQTALSNDGAMTVHAADLGLLELAPGPENDQYQFKAKIRHEKSNLLGAAGIYFCHQSIPWSEGSLQCFIELTFNDVISAAEMSPPDLAATRKQPVTNYVHLIYHVYSEEGAQKNIDNTMGLVAGPRFINAGEEKSDWHDIVVTVSPMSIRIEWDGQPFEIARDRLNKRIEEATAIFKDAHQDNPSAEAIEPKLTLRGGLGLSLRRGSASFRDVSVTPMPPVP